MKPAILRVGGLKVALPLPADQLPRNLVPADGPPGSPTLDVIVGDGALVARAQINGKNYRKLMKLVAEHGAAHVTVALQGLLRPPPRAGEPWTLSDAGFQYFTKTRPPAPAAGEPPAAEPAAQAPRGLPGGEPTAPDPAAGEPAG
jgi:hypothetical protein